MHRLPLARYKDLFWQLTIREIKAKYKQSILGYAWVLLVPLINLVVLTIVFKYLFRVPTSNIPYPVFLFTALVPWTFLSNALSTATGSIISNGSLVTKVTLPREIFPLASISSKLIDLLLTGMVLIGFLIFYHIPFHLTLFLVPVIFLIQLMLMIGVSFILSATNTFFRDVENLLAVFLTVWMYLTPIIYSYQMIPSGLRKYFNLNPMTPVINSYRNVILDGVLPNWYLLAYSFAIALFFFLFGLWFFRRRARNFADVI